MENNTVKIRLSDELDRSELFGNMDSNLRLLQEQVCSHGILAKAMDED